MYRILIIVVIIALSTVKVSAQNSIDKILSGMINRERDTLSLSRLKDNIGKDVYLKGLITARKSLNDSVTYLYVGGVYPNHQLTVIIKGKKVNQDLVGLIPLNESIFSGNLFWVDDKPTLTVTSNSQVCKQILL